MNMRKVIGVLAEEVLLAVCLVLMVTHSSGRMTFELAGIFMAAMGSAVLISIAVESVITYLPRRTAVRPQSTSSCIYRCSSCRSRARLQGRFLGIPLISADSSGTVQM